MLLLTGFDVFSNFKKNPSWEVARAIEMEDVIVEKIPVSYEDVKNITRELLRKHKPQAVISLGLADGRAQISIEMVAINFMHAKKPDNRGYAPSRKKIFEDGEDAYFSTLPVFSILDRWHEKGIPSYVSYHAGTYVCNTLFYSFLYHAKRMNMNIPIGFIHLPSSEDMVLKRENRPYVEFNTMRKAVETAIEVTFRHLSSP